MSDAVELERLVVRLVGDASQYNKTLNNAVRDTKAAERTINQIVDTVMQSHNRVMEEAARVTRAARTPLEQYKEALADLDSYYAAGAISSETYRRSVDKLNQEFEQGKYKVKAIGNEIQAVGTKMRNMGAMITFGVTMPVVGLGYAFVKAGADAEEMMAKFGQVFGSQGGAVQSSLDDFAAAAGRSKIELRGMAADLGALIGPMGFTEKATGEMSVQLTKLAVDLSSFFNVSESEALTALRAGLVGETEPLRRLGVQLNSAKIEAEAFALGLIKEKEEMTDTAKAQAIMSLVMRDTAKAQGDAVRTSDSLTNQTRKAKGELKDLSVELGTMLIPYMLDLAKAVMDAVKWFKELSPETKKTILTAAAFAAIVGPVLAILGTFIQAVGLTVKAIGGIVTGVGAAIGAIVAVVSAIGAMLATVTGIIVLAVAALVAAVAAAVAAVVYYWDEIVAAAKWLGNILSEIWKGIATVWSLFWEGLGRAFSALWEQIAGPIEEGFDWIYDVVSDALIAVGDTWSAGWDVLTGFFGGIWDGIAGAVESAFGWLDDMVGGALTAVGKAWSAGWNALAGFFGGIWDGIRGLIGPALEWVGDKVDAAMNWAGEKWSSGWNAVKNFFNRDTSPAVKGAVKNMLDTITNSISSSGINAAWNSVMNSVTSAADQTAGRVTNVFRKMMINVKQMMAGLKETKDMELMGAYNKAMGSKPSPFMLSVDEMNKGVAAEHAGDFGTIAAMTEKSTPLLSAYDKKKGAAPIPSGGLPVPGGGGGGGSKSKGEDPAVKAAKEAEKAAKELAEKQREIMRMVTEASGDEYAVRKLQVEEWAEDSLQKHGDDMIAVIAIEQIKTDKMKKIADDEAAATLKKQRDTVALLNEAYKNEYDQRKAKVNEWAEDEVKKYGDNAKAIFAIQALRVKKMLEIERDMFAAKTEMNEKAAEKQRKAMRLITEANGTEYDMRRLQVAEWAEDEIKKWEGNAEAILAIKKLETERLFEIEKAMFEEMNKEEIQKAEELQRRWAEVWNTMGDSVAKGFEDAILEGNSAKDIFKSIIDDVKRAAIRAAFTQPLTQMLGGFFGNAFGGMTNSGGPVMGAPSAGGGVGGFGGGGLMNVLGGVLGFAAEGGVYNSPVIAGEAGAEAVIPLASGNVPVEFNGSRPGGDSTVNTYNITIKAMDTESIQDALARGGAPIILELAHRAVKEAAPSVVANDIENGGQMRQYVARY